VITIILEFDMSDNSYHLTSSNTGENSTVTVGGAARVRDPSPTAVSTPRA